MTSTQVRAGTRIVLVLLVTFAAVRVGAVLAADPRVMVDSADYQAMARYPVGELLAGGLEEPFSSERLPRAEGPAFPLIEKPPAVPLLYKAVGPDRVGLIVAVQAVLGAACWAALAWVGWLWSRRVWVAVAVLLVGLCPQVAMWDAVVMSESLSTSAMVATVAAGGWLAMGWSRPRLALLLGAAAVFGLSRDVNAYLLAFTTAAVVGLVLLHRVDWRWLAVAAGLTVVFGVAWHGAQAGERELVPLYHVMTKHVLTRPDLTEAMAERGMPDSPGIRSTAGGIYRDVTDNPDLAGFARWVRDDGQATYLRTIASRPVWAVTEPFTERQVVYDTGLTERSWYTPAWTAPLPDSVARWLVPSSDLALGLHLLVIAFAARRHPALLGVVGCAVLLYVLNWHGDGNEFGRHANPAFVILALATIAALAQTPTNTRMIAGPQLASPPNIENTLPDPVSEAIAHL